MTNAPTPPAGGGMPKWVIILIVVILFFGIGCCGGVATCNWMCSRAVKTVGQAIQEHGADWAKEAQANIDKAQAAERARAAAQNGAPAAGINGGTVTPNPENVPATNGGGNAGNAGNTLPTQTTDTTAHLPANFPSDLPVYTGMTSTPLASDNITGAGAVMLRGTASKSDIQTFYRNEMKKQGWTATQDMDIAELSQLVFEKDQRTALVQIVSDKDKPGQIVVTITYSKK